MYEDVEDAATIPKSCSEQPTMEMGKKSGLHDNIVFGDFVPKGRNTRRVDYNMVWPR
jgi:hypothetical protein